MGMSKGMSDDFVKMSSVCSDENILCVDGSSDDDADEDDDREPNFTMAASKRITEAMMVKEIRIIHLHSRMEKREAFFMVTTSNPIYSQNLQQGRKVDQ